MIVECRDPAEALGGGGAAGGPGRLPDHDVADRLQRQAHSRVGPGGAARRCRRLGAPAGSRAGGRRRRRRRWSIATLDRRDRARDRAGIGRARHGRLRLATKRPRARAFGEEVRRSRRQLSGSSPTTPRTRVCDGGGQRRVGRRRRALVQPRSRAGARRYWWRSQETARARVLASGREPCWRRTPRHGRSTPVLQRVGFRGERSTLVVRASSRTTSAAKLDRLNETRA
jgi:hypothetical protein